MDQEGETGQPPDARLRSRLFANQNEYDLDQVLEGVRRCPQRALLEGAACWRFLKNAAFKGRADTHILAAIFGLTR
jgi:hypothetical protein